MEKRENAIINRLTKTKTEVVEVDLGKEKLDMEKILTTEEKERQRQQKAALQQQQRDQKRLEKERKDREAYEKTIMVSNRNNDYDLEDDFM